MKSEDDKVKALINEAKIETGSGVDERILADALSELEKLRQKRLTRSQQNVWRIIMKNPITKLAAAAAVIAMIGLAIFEFISTGSKSSVVWAEVAKKVEASRGCIYRNRATRSGRSDMSDYSMVYLSATHSRTDSYKGDKINRTTFCDFDGKTVVFVAHDTKNYIREAMSEQTLREQHGAWANPSRWVQEFLSKDYKKLGQKTTNGVLCEGLETTDPTFGVANFQVDSLVARVWVSIETGYPVLLEAEVVGDNGQLHIKGILDRFQWDVVLDASLFEPNIPPDYTRLQLR
jgi:outer membrane lipoprotein-sorting protein